MLKLFLYKWKGLFIKQHKDSGRQMDFKPNGIHAYQIATEQHNSQTEAILAELANKTKSNRSNNSFCGNNVNAKDSKLYEDFEQLRKLLCDTSSVQTKIDSFDRIPKKNYSATKQAFGTLGLVLPTARRVSSVPDSIEVGDNTRAAGMIGLAAANFPCDLREMRGGYKDLKNIYTGTQGAMNGLQHPVSFFRGTCLNWLTEKFPILNKMDKTLYETDFGRSVYKKLGVVSSESVNVAEELGLKKGSKV